VKALSTRIETPYRIAAGTNTRTHVHRRRVLVVEEDSMNDITEGARRSIANPRRTTLTSRSVAEATTPHAAAPEDGGLQLLADDGAVCVDGSCALPD
jgi:hypothetical protein